MNVNIKKKTFISAYNQFKLMSGEDQEYVDQIEEDALKTNNKEDTNE